MRKHLVLTLGLALASPVLLAQNSGTDDDRNPQAATPATPATPAVPAGSGNSPIDGPRDTKNGGKSGSVRSNDNSLGVTGNPNDKSAKTRSRGGAANTEFGSLDANGDNKISQDELRLNVGLSARFSEADQNSDGNLSRGEFAKLEESTGGEDSTTTPMTEGSDRTSQDDDLNRRLGGG